MKSHDDALGEIKSLTEATDESHSQYLADMQERDEAVREAIRDGVTMYRIAQVTGLTQQAVRKIRDR